MVLDVACGTGINFALIEERIGPQGRLVGIDLSAEMLGLAADRVRSQGWENVSLIESAIEAAQLPGPFDAALFSLTHDVLQAPDAIERVLRQLKPGGRVASFGSKWAPRWAVPVNLVVWLIARRYVTTFAGFERPWKMLVRQIDLRVESLAFGGAYLAWGTKGNAGGRQQRLRCGRAGGRDGRLAQTTKRLERPRRSGPDWSTGQRSGQAPVGCCRRGRKR